MNAAVTIGRVYAPDVLSLVWSVMRLQETLAVIKARTVFNPSSARLVRESASTVVLFNARWEITYGLRITKARCRIPRTAK